MLPLKVQNAGFGYDRIENVLYFMNGNVLNNGLFTEDGLHPNEKGYEMLGDQLSRELKN